MTAAPTFPSVPTSRRLSHVPEHLRPGGPAPAAGPLDQLARARLRRLLAGYLGEVPTLDAHLDLLDVRGAWYAEKALGAWPAHQPDSFFGLVRHVVRTQLDGPPPDPDIEAWLAAGRPADADLAQTWDTMVVFRYPLAQRPAAIERRVTTAAVNRVDEVVTGWPQGQLESFMRAYGALDQILERRQFVLPPIDR